MNFVFQSTFKKVKRLRYHLAVVRIVLQIAVVKMAYLAHRYGRRLHASLRGVWTRLHSLPFRRWLRAVGGHLRSRYVLWVVILNMVPVALLLWLYFGNYVVLAAVMSLHNSAWWNRYELITACLGAAHGCYSIVLVVQRRLPPGYWLSTAVAFGPFAYAYAMYLHEVKMYTLAPAAHRIVEAIVVLNPFRI